MARTYNIGGERKTLEEVKKLFPFGAHTFFKENLFDAYTYAERAYPNVSSNHGWKLHADLKKELSLEEALSKIGLTPKAVANNSAVAAPSSSGSRPAINVSTKNSLSFDVTDRELFDKFKGRFHTLTGGKASDVDEDYFEPVRRMVSASKDYDYQLKMASRGEKHINPMHLLETIATIGKNDINYKMGHQYGTGRMFTFYGQSLEERDRIISAIEGSPVADYLQDVDDPSFRAKMGSYGSEVESKNAPVSKHLNTRFTTDYLDPNRLDANGVPIWKYSADPDVLNQGNSPADAFRVTGKFGPDVINDQLEAIKRITQESPEMAEILHGKPGYSSPYGTIDDIIRYRTGNSGSIPPPAQSTPPPTSPPAQPTPPPTSSPTQPTSTPLTDKQLRDLAGSVDFNSNLPPSSSIDDFIQRGASLGSDEGDLIPQLNKAFRESGIAKVGISFNAGNKVDNLTRDILGVSGRGSVLKGYFPSDTLVPDDPFAAALITPDPELQAAQRLYTGLDSVERLVTEEGINAPSNVRNILQINEGASTANLAYRNFVNEPSATRLFARATGEMFHELGHAASTKSGARQSITDAGNLLDEITRPPNVPGLSTNFSPEEYSGRLSKYITERALEEARAESFRFAALGRTEIGKAYKEELKLTGATVDDMSSTYYEFSKNNSPFGTYVNKELERLRQIGVDVTDDFALNANIEGHAAFIQGVNFGEYSEQLDPLRENEIENTRRYLRDTHGQDYADRYDDALSRNSQRITVNFDDVADNVSGQIAANVAPDPATAASGATTVPSSAPSPSPTTTPPETPRPPSSKKGRPPKASITSESTRPSSVSGSDIIEETIERTSSGAPSKRHIKTAGKEMSERVVKGGNLKTVGLGAILGIGAMYGLSERRRTVDDNIQRRLEMQRNNYY